MSAETIAAIWRYPVKSMRGEELSAAAINERGLPADRVMALIDRETGKVASAKHPRRWGRLLDCAAAVATIDDDGTVSIRVSLPDGRTLMSGDEAIDEALSELFGRSVTLSYVPPHVAETEREYPVVQGLPVSGMFFSGQIGLGAPPATFFDYAPIHLLTTATLAELRRVEPNSDCDCRRFR
ncbi:MAG TPA: MOSC N-terminal beta barrel domain-containing protein, partial [Nitrolancea sp.]|nr:MOSC N-terminal beta barrel domain-containing protein [Nitrolancea sp.]